MISVGLAETSLLRLSRHCCFLACFVKAIDVVIVVAVVVVVVVVVVIVIVPEMVAICLMLSNEISFISFFTEGDLFFPGQECSS